MKTLYLDCGMGAAGDMLMSALLELIPEPDAFIEKLNGIGIPNVKIERQRVEKCGIVGSGVKVTVHGVEEEHIHEHHHDHEHEHEHHHKHSHHHSHTGMGEIEGIIASLKVSDRVKADVLAVYRLIAEAESAAHGKTVEQIHFHEVGMMDAVADITGVCMLIEAIAPERIAASPVHVGSGTVECAHGVLPVPAPATAYILRGVPTFGGEVRGELCTPTGAALLRHFADEFTPSNAMNVEKIGYGMGKRHFYNENGTELLSAVRVMLGETDGGRDRVIMLQCNIDDMTGEELGYASEQLLSEGALDVYLSPIYMKKNRPAQLLNVICRPDDRERMVGLIFRHITTIGIRETEAGRYILNRSEETVHTKYGDIRIKKSSGYGVSREKAEYEDLKKIAEAKGVSILDLKDKE